MEDSPKMGRTKINVDWLKVDVLCRCQCTEEEIAADLEMSSDTLYRRCKEDHDMTFAEYFALKRKRGFTSLRAKQYEKAMAGDGTMLIWLGKQYLEQTEKVFTRKVVDHSNDNLKLLPKKDLKELQRIKRELDKEVRDAK